MGKNCRKWAKIAENGQKLPKMGKNCRKWVKIAENGQKLPKISRDYNIDPSQKRQCSFPKTFQQCLNLFCVEAD
jgi:hypothetical protein